MDAIWTSLDAGAQTCSVLHNTLAMMMDIIRGDLDVLTTDDLIDLLERISSTFVQSPLCLELIEDDLNELFGLVPGYIKSERLYLRSEELKQKDGARSGGRRRC